MTYQQRLDELCAEHDVPGATLGVLHDGTVETYGFGVCSEKNRIEVEPDTLFQIGSITKVYTTTMLMQLVDEGALDLDESVKTYLPDFALSDDATTDAVTTRQLLTHTSGIADLDFGLFGRGDDCVERFTTALAGRPMLHDPGAFCSYCNSGFVVAGRIVEVLRKQTWDEALREHIIKPLGMTRTVTLAEEAIVHRAATGHEQHADGSQHVASVWGIPRSAGPAGLIVSTAEDVLKFAQLHLDDDKLAVMQVAQTDLPPAGDGHRGLGWHLYEWAGPSGGVKVVGHDGGTFGQLAFLRLVPSRNFAITLLTNGYGGISVNRHLFDEIVSERLGITPTPDPVEPAEPVSVDTSRFTGQWEWQGMTVEVYEADGSLMVKLIIAAEGDDAQPPEIPPAAMRPISDSRFLVRIPPLQIEREWVFLHPSKPGPFTHADLHGRLMHRA